MWSLSAGVGQYVKQRFKDEGRTTGLSLEMLDMLHALARHPNTVVYVLSAITVSSMSRTSVASLPEIGLASENGSVISWSSRHSHPTLHTAAPFRTPLSSTPRSGSAEPVAGYREWDFTSPLPVGVVRSLTMLRPDSLSALPLAASRARASLLIRCVIGCSTHSACVRLCLLIAVVSVLLACRKSGWP